MILMTMMSLMMRWRNMIMVKMLMRSRRMMMIKMTRRVCSWDIERVSAALKFDANDCSPEKH